MTAPAPTRQRAPQAGESPFRLGDRPGLDGLRGVAVLLVVAFHTSAFVLHGRDRGRFFPGGFIGVNVFFVLSGFLITSLLLEEHRKAGRVSFRRFYTRRARRLLPALTVMIAAYLVWSSAYGDPVRTQLPAIGAIGLFGANLAPAFGVTIPLPIGNTWSLGIEEQFYLLWPAALLLLRRCRARTVIGVLALAATAMTVASAVAFQIHPATHGVLETGAEANGLIVGCCLAYALHRGWTPPRWLRAATVPALVVLGVTTATTSGRDAWLPSGGFLFVALAVGVVILDAIDDTSVLGRLLSWSPLRYCGKISYAVYLWHVFLFFAVMRAWPQLATPERLVICLGATAAVSVASRYVVELPFTRRRPAPARVPAVAVISASAPAPQ